MENKIETRTQELAQSVSELRALGEVSQAVERQARIKRGGVSRP
jgi:hypothetical protein